MKLTNNNGLWLFECTFKEKEYAQKAGFTWNANIKAWQSDNDLKALKLIEFADNNAKELLTKLQEKMQIDTQNKAKELANFEVVMPANMQLKPFQKEGVFELLNRQNVLLADDMGLGKTAQAIAYCNMKYPKKILIVCPNSLKINWYKEFRKFCVHDYTFHICTGKDAPQLSMNVNIINYDILEKHKEILASAKFDLVVADEAHYVKNTTAKRSKAFYGIKDISKKIAITGTPIPNRPIEAFAILKWLDKDTFSNRSKYAYKYCNAHFDGWGWNENGASNLEELQELLRNTVMVRRLKKDVLKDLPPKTRQIVELGTITAREKAEQLALIKKMEAMEFQSEYEKQASELRSDFALLFSELAKIRKENALKKLNDCIEHIKDLLNDTQKVVVFCHHREILESLVNGLSEFKPVYINGETSMQDRDKIVVQFQNDNDTRVFVGSIKACAEGLTLTASNVVVFVELDWTPAKMSQAEDRCHRIGQSNNVLIQHLVRNDSIDVYMAQTLINKQAIIDKALN